jgi:hypothetical protein
MTLTRMNTIFHVDLSDANPDEEYWIPAGQGLRHVLVRHTNETMDKLLSSTPRLAAKSNLKLTHFTQQAVAVTASAVARIYVRHTLRTVPGAKGVWGVTHSGIHIPPPKHVLQKLQAEGTPHSMELDYVSTAKNLVFHHPELISMNEDTARIIYDYMDDDPNISLMFEEIATRMRQMGPPSETDGWATLVPFTPDKNDGLKTPIDGKTTYYMQQPAQEVIDACGPAMTAMLKVTKNDKRLENIKYVVREGTSVESHDGAKQLARAQSLKGEKWKVKVANDKEVHGLALEASVVSAEEKKVKLLFKNTFIRYLGGYIRFINANDKPIEVPDWKAEDAGVTTRIINEVINPQYKDVRFLGQIEPVNSFFAIPIAGDPGRLQVTVKLPADAVRAEIYGSGMGHGDNPWPLTPLVGGVYTGVFNLGVPSFMLAFGVAKQSYKPLYDIINEISENKAVIGVVATLATAYYGNAFVGHATSYGGVNWKALASLASTIFNWAFGKVLVEIEKDLAEGAVTDSIPFAGWLVVAVNIATGVAQLAQTIVEVATSPWNIQHSLSTSITTNVVIKPDPRHNSFPRGDGKRTYKVKMIYKDEIRPTQSHTYDVPEGHAQDTLPAAFADNTLGGMIKIEVDFFLGDWLAGKATTGWIKNDDVNASKIEVMLVELAKPLTDKSVYVHNAILTYQNNELVWMPSKNAPTATIASRNTAANGNAISEWAGITLNQRLGRIGFAWKAAGMGVPSCTSGQTGQLYAMQSVDVPGAVMKNVKFPPCAFDGPTQLIYDPFPPKFKMENGQWVIVNGKPVPDESDVKLGNYYVDPRKANVALTEGGGYHLRQVSLDGKDPFDVSSNLSWGRFPFFPDSFALHPAGHLVAVSTRIGKIQITTLATRGSADTDVPVARAYAGEARKRDRRGLLFNPIAVACAYDGTILVLEDAKYSTGSEDITVSRIQAFDLLGNPVNRFGVGKDASPFLQIAEEKGITYLDLAVVGDEKRTYIYALYYRGNGASPADYHVTIYQYGTDGTPLQNPLVTTDKVAAAKLTVDMWHTMYTLNFDMVTDGKGNPAGPQGGPGVGPAGRTIPSVSEWVPPVG